MGLDVSGSHSPSIESDDLVIKTGKAALTFGENDRLETGIPVSRNVNIEIAELPFDSLLIAAVSGIAGLLAGCSVFLVAEMFSHLSLHRSLQ